MILTEQTCHLFHLVLKQLDQVFRQPPQARTMCACLTGLVESTAPNLYGSFHSLGSLITWLFVLLLLFFYTRQLVALNSKNEPSAWNTP
jgi:hypothetical protein